MINANLDSLSCVSCNFSFSSMRKVDMINVTIEKSMFDFVELPNASLHRAKFGKHVSFYGSSMYGVNGTYTYFKHCQFEFARLNYAILDYTKIEESKFYNAQIIGTSMKYGVLIRVNFTSAYLFKSKWNHIRCEQCIFHSTNFTDTDLTNAMFIQSDFRYALITEEQLRQAASLKGSILPNGTVVNEK
ncbi:hypothetical protein I4U23_010462 [Adineta vaga]|nr:hypothetical protein I4U23_010462 [Adineta vaga]